VEEPIRTRRRLRPLNPQLPLDDAHRLRRSTLLVGQSSVALALAIVGCGGSESRAAPPTRLTSTTRGTPTTARATSSVPRKAASTIDTAIEVYGNCATPSVEPTEIVLTCGDYGWVLEGLNWTSWTSTRATAVGTLVYNDCQNRPGTSRGPCMAHPSRFPNDVSDKLSPRSVCNLARAVVVRGLPRTCQLSWN